MLVLLHGFSGGPSSWDGLMGLLPTDADVVRPTLFGHGSDWKKRPIESFAGEVHRLSEELGRSRGPHQLCGYSLGGRVALALLAENPELFRSAVIIGAHPGLKSAGSRAERLKMDQGRAETLRKEGVHAFVDRWESLPLFETQQRLMNDVLRAQRELRMSHDPNGLARSLEVLGLAQMPDLRPSLGRVECPVTLLVGELDYNFVLLAEEMSGLLPRARVLTVSGVGHNVVLESPEAVADALARADRAS